MPFVWWFLGFFFFVFQVLFTSDRVITNTFGSLQNQLRYSINLFLAHFIIFMQRNIWMRHTRTHGTHTTHHVILHGLFQKWIIGQNHRSFSFFFSSFLFCVQNLNVVFCSHFPRLGFAENNLNVRNSPPVPSPLLSCYFDAKYGEAWSHRNQQVSHGWHLANTVF